MRVSVYLCICGAMSHRANHGIDCISSASQHELFVKFIPVDHHSDQFRYDDVGLVAYDSFALLYPHAEMIALN